METVTVQEANEKLLAMITNTTKEQSKYRITSTEGTAIMLSEENYENLLITLEMLSTPFLVENMSEMQH